MRPPSRGVLADPHPVTCMGLRTLLATIPITLVGAAADGDAAQRLCQDYHPDLLLFDPTLPGPPATEVITLLHTHCPQTQVLVLTAHNDAITVRALLAAGVAGYVLKSEPLEVIVKAIRRVVQGGTWWSPAIVEQMIHRQQEQGTGVTLTAREQQIVALLARGWDHTRIADDLQLAVQTVRNYTHRLYTKLGVHSRAEVVVWARERGIT